MGADGDDREGEEEEEEVRKGTQMQNNTGVIGGREQSLGCGSKGF